MSSGRPPYPEAQCHFMNTDGRDELTAYMAANLPMLRLLAYMDSTGRAGGSYNTFAAGPSPDNPITVPRPTIHNNWGVGSAQIPEPLSRYMGYLGLPPSSSAAPESIHAVFDTRLGLVGKGIDYLTAYIGLAAAAGAKLVPPSSVYEGLRPIVRPVCEPELRPMDSGITHVSYYAQESGDGPVVAVATYIDDYGPEPIRSYTAADAPDLATARGLPVHLTRWPRDSRYPSFTSIRTAAEEPITNAVGTIIASATIMCMPLEARPLNNAG